MSGLRLVAMLGIASLTQASYEYPPCPSGDSRCIPEGVVFSNKTNSYAEQPYCMMRTDDEWVCGLTYNEEGWAEGTPGEHMVSMHTHDRGLTWGNFSVIEAPNFGVDSAMTSSYGSVFGRPDGSRVFAVYTYNSHNLTGVPGAKPSVHWRADMMGPYSLRYSDDLGETWSPERFEVPVPFTAVDRANEWNGTEHDGWEVDQVKIVNGSIAMFGFTKIQKYCLIPPEEMYIAVSRDLLSVSDVGSATWEFWPEADHGLLPPGGNPQIGEEPHVVPLEWGGFQVLMRSSQGYMGSVVSGLDPKQPWGLTGYARYAPIQGPGNGAPPLYTNDTWWLKQPRGPLTPKRQPNGMVLMSFNHNAGFAGFATAADVMDRCVIWLSAGVEDESSPQGELLWSQPELALYDPERTHDHGYPDILTTSDEKVYILETYKGAARLHREAGSLGRRHQVDGQLLAALFAQRRGGKPSLASGVVASFTDIPELLPLPKGALSADFMAGKRGDKQSPYRNGFSFDVWVRPGTLPGEDTVLFRTMKAGNASIALLARANGSVAIEMVDQNNLSVGWGTDPECTSALVGGENVLHHVGVVADAGPNMLMFTVDGKLCDGGRSKDWPAGWKLFNQAFSRPGAISNTLEILPGLVGKNVTRLMQGRVYSRALFVSELVANYRVGPTVS